MFISVNAGPGSGKTYTICLSYLVHQCNANIPKNTTDEQHFIFDYIRKELPQTKKVAFFAHTNSVKDTLIRRLPSNLHKYVKTYHGHGQSALIGRYGYQRPVNNRLDTFISHTTGKSLYDLPKAQIKEWIAIKRLVNCFKQEFVLPSQESFNYCIEKYPELGDCLFPIDWLSRCNKLMNLSSKVDGTVEYSDMLWLAAKTCFKPKYDIGYVDECQDLSGASLELVRRLCKDVVFVGDPNQAIMAFCGADERMFNKVQAHSEAVLPLKTTFRCPPNIIERANDLIPNSVLPGPNTKVGHDKTITYSEYLKRISTLTPVNNDGSYHTLTLARTNAPLIGVGTTLLQKKVPAKLADKDLGNRLIKYVQGLRCGSISNLGRALEDSVSAACKFRNKFYAIVIEEQAHCIMALSSGCSSLTALYDKIKAVCNVDDKSAHLLSTIHKAKGLEAEVVFILDPPVEHPLSAGHPIAGPQETNLHFVALTRTKRDLFWVR